MVKSLNGSELAGFIKQRHAGQVRALRSRKVYPKLAIVQLKDDPVINTYVRLKKGYGADIGVEVDVYTPKEVDAPKLLDKLSSSDDVHGIIVQLPLPNPERTDEIVNLVAPDKDVDALGKNALFEPATPMAILWLLAGYNINLVGQKVLIIGRGKLVGGPLEKILKDSGLNVSVAVKESADLGKLVKEANIVISAANEAEILTSDMLEPGQVIVDAGVAGEDGKTTGNVSSDVYKRTDLTITPQKGGVGPLTVCALFENVIRAASDAKG
ncbi:bifunctional 5,10-methylenetetrahydrofolate dehydrogenase/5,10-methenyltetrahydrofolate cyclohydrolase [Candidatus Saccharibacteria bacterium]|nr:bifunctional 5,10-methylenetetrahydrofolate dehydrogenase/5,10-methenyltetrahydrofolate cyclohydrolase [Candidatus Saccharibacteria bacterium]